MSTNFSTVSQSAQHPNLRRTWSEIFFPDPFDQELTHPPGIAEWYCPVMPGTGLHPRPGSSESLQSFFPEVNIVSWPTLLYPSRKGETIEQLHDRVDTFALAFAPALKRRLPGKHQRLLLVTHAATAIALVRTFVGDRGLQMKAGCCTLNVLERKANVDPGLIIGGWKAQNISHGDYLTGGIAREWGFENVMVEQGRVSILDVPLRVFRIDSNIFKGCGRPRNTGI